MCENAGLAASLNHGFDVGEDLHRVFAVFLLFAVMAC